MTPADVIDDVKRLLQDAIFLRGPDTYTDATLLKLINQTIRRMAIMRPDLFTTVADIATTPDAVLQSLPSGGARLVAVYSANNGGTITAVTEAGREVLDRTVPTWVAEASGTPRNFMRHQRNPERFFLYPRPESGVTLSCEYVDTPPNYAVGDTIGFIPDVYFPTLVAGVVSLVESIHESGIQSGRAKLYDEIFIRDLGTDSSNRAIVDNDNAGVPTPVKQPLSRSK